MSRRLLIFDEPNRFLAGAVGPPGNRSFYLQARQGRAVATLGLEKTQVAALAQRIGELLASADEPAAASSDATFATADAVEPKVELFRVGMLAIGWDPETSSLTIEARAIDEEGEYPAVGDDDPDGPDLLRVRLTSSQGMQFARSAAALVTAGRPTCPFCGQPLDPGGHFCSRMNGHLN